MPRSPEPATQSLPSERLRVGDCLVDVPLREVHAPGKRRPLRITPKSMGVLRVLVEQAGRVVGRDALMAEVWPDTLPTNDVVTQAITQLRKAFDDERGNPRYIETIAKNGYRLLAPVEWLPAGDDAGAGDARWSDPSRSTGQYPALPAEDPSEPLEPLPLPPQSSARGGWRSIAGAIGAVLLLVVSLVAWAWLRDGRNAAPADGSGALSLRSERPYRLITSMPGPETSPTLSPDAAMVAYVAVPDGQLGNAIMVQTTEQTQPRQLTRPPDGGDDGVPAWSPDGRWIAFARMVPGQSCSIHVVAPNARGEREIGACDRHGMPSFDWAPGGDGLIFGSMPTARGAGGLRVLDLASGDWRDIAYDRRDDDLDIAPRYSPDGRWIVFVRNAPLGDFWRIPAAGGKPERLSRLQADIRGWDWLPDGQGLVFGAMIDGETRLFRLDPANGEVRPLGIGDALSPVVAHASAAMAFVSRRPYYSLYRVALGEGAEGGRVHVLEPLFPSSSREVLPAVAPDGRQLAFLSDRSGSNGLWWVDLDRPDSLRMISGVRPMTRFAPNWSADARRLLVVGTDAAGRSILQEVAPASGRATTLPLPLPEPQQAAYLPDAERLLVLAGTGDGRLRLYLLDRSRQPWRVLAAIDDVSRFQVDAARGRVLFSRQTQAGLWQADLDLGPLSLRRLNAEAPTTERHRMWTVAPDGQVLYLDQRQGCAATLRRDGPSDHQGATRCLDQTRRAAINGFDLSPRGDVLYLALVEWDGADIGFMELPKEPGGTVPGWIK